MLNAAIWPTLDYSRVPYRLYHDPEAYQREQERIFRGPTWNFLGLEAEIPNPGDFRTTYVGDIPVIVNRDANGTILWSIAAPIVAPWSGARSPATPASTPVSIINGVTASMAGCSRYRFAAASAARAVSTRASI